MMEPYVYFNIDGHIKNAGPGWVGGRWQVGKTEPLPLAVMLAKLTKIVLDHYMQFEDTDTLNNNLDKFRQVINDVRIIEEAPDHD